MNRVNRALISVHNKTDILKMSDFLIKKNVNIISTGKTYDLLKNLDHNGLLNQVSNITGFPEILDGRVKTLHPAIFGPVLAKRDNENEFEPINLVITNLYPFEKMVEDKNDNLILDNIDIGGHSLIRAAAKNYKDVLIVTDINDYNNVINNWDNISLDMKRTYAAKAYHKITEYDMAISKYFNKDKYLYKSYAKNIPLKYGTNPQQSYAAIYNDFPFTIINGKIGYINTLDLIYSWQLVKEISQATGLIASASFKHNSPAGVSICRKLTDEERSAYLINGDISDVATAFIRSRNSDPMSSFGDFIAISGLVDECCAKLIKNEVSDGIVALDFTEGALDILRSKKDGKYVILKGQYTYDDDDSLEVRELHGVTLVQEKNKATTNFNSFNKDIPDNNKLDLIIGNTTLKYTQSNSVCAVRQGQVIGIGAGQQSRIDCVKIVKRKVQLWYLRRHPKVIKLHSLFKKGVKRTDKINAIIQYIEGDIPVDPNLFEVLPELLSDEDKQIFLKNLNNVSVASDAFLPFTDNVMVAKQFGAEYIIQPGGSVMDKQVIEMCKSLNINMVFTGPNMRLFLH